MALTKQETQKIIKDFSLSDGDTGSPGVQIALLTNRIVDLTGHFKTHIHDFHSRRGLLRMVSQRRKLLDYLKSKNIDRYREILKRLNLRR